jgi:hypothetical protein
MAGLAVGAGGASVGRIEDMVAASAWAIGGWVWDEVVGGVAVPLYIVAGSFGIRYGRSDRSGVVRWR